jgi:5-methyltetrahydropteroyltriglutamate--homocysteine methyltransferase
VVGPIERRESVEVQGALDILRVFDRPLKVTLPGPFTMAQLCQDDYYADEGDRAMAFAEAVRSEVRDLFAVGVAMVQIDEPYLQARPDRARDYALPAIERALADAGGRTVLHSCFGYGQYVKDKPTGYPFFSELASCAADDISIESAQPDLDLACLTELGHKNVQLGVIDCGSHEVETPNEVARRLERAIEVVPAERLAASPDCGMKYLPRPVARQKLRSLVDGAALVRAGLGA